MILNKFRPCPLSNKLKALSLQLLAISLFSCNKTANINANKAFVGMTHVAYEEGPLDMAVDNIYLFSGPVAFGQTSGTTGNPYDTVTSRISKMQILLATDSTAVIPSGNASFQQGAQYSVFIYDTLDQRSINLIILQDNPAIRTDTFTYIRYLNFSPGPIIWGLKLINTRNDIPYSADTVIVYGGSFVGYYPNPGSYYFTMVQTGNYNVFAFRDSSNPRMDSSNFYNLGPLTIGNSKNYNVYLQGFYGDSISVNKFQLKSVPLN